MRHPLLLLPLVALAAPAFAQTPDPSVAAAVADPARKPEHRARDQYRHPIETLAFFGVKPSQTIVEFYPGGGWYTDILGPLAKNGGGKYIALVPGNPRGIQGAQTLLSNRDRYGETTVASFNAADGTSDIPAGTADVVLTFRNVHNLMMNGDGSAAANAFKAFFAALKPGGTLGVVDHRLPEDRAAGEEKTSGYIKRSTIVRLATAAGFRLAGESQVNANPKDTANHPQGVWTLPPSLRLGETDRAKYQAIGESDRLTLKFTKPS